MNVTSGGKVTWEPNFKHGEFRARAVAVLFLSEDDRGLCVAG